MGGGRSPHALSRCNHLAPAVRVDRFDITLQQSRHDVTLVSLSEHYATLLIDGQRTVVGYRAQDAATLILATDRQELTLVNTDLIPPEAAEEALGGKVLAPMHGQLVSVLVEANAKVDKDQRLAVFEAMKMQHEILAPVAGTVSELLGQVGQQMAGGDVVMVIEETTDD